jgi:catechol-2,3-dioxygenase
MTSLAEFPISARAAASDLDRARRWYEGRLGLLPEHEDRDGAWYRFAGETWLYLYATPSAGTAKNTIAGWEVRDIETVMSELRERGVVFEQYDLGEVPMVDGLADFGVAKAAWFNDSEGNTYELTEVRPDP